MFTPKNYVSAKMQRYFFFQFLSFFFLLLFISNFIIVPNSFLNGLTKKRVYVRNSQIFRPQLFITLKSDVHSNLRLIYSLNNVIFSNQELESF